MFNLLRAYYKFLKQSSAGPQPYPQQYYPGVPPYRHAPQQWGLPQQAMWPPTSDPRQPVPQAAPNMPQPSYAPPTPTWSAMPQPSQAWNSSPSAQPGTRDSAASALLHDSVIKRMVERLAVLEEPIPTLPAVTDEATLKETRQALETYKSKVAEATLQFGKIKQGVLARYDGAVPSAIKETLEAGAHALKERDTELATLISEAEALHRAFDAA